MLKLLIFLTLISTAFAQTSSPRETMETFLKSMVQIKKQNLNHNLFFKQAISTFDLSNFNDNIKFNVGKKYAENLIYIFDRMEKIDYSTIPDKMDTDKWVYNKSRDQYGKIKEISIEKIKGKWLFSKETFKSLNFYTEQVKSKEVVKEVIASKLTHDLRDFLPKSFRSKVFLVENWQWVGVLLLLLIAFIIEHIIGFIAGRIVNANFGIFKHASSDHLQKALVPFRRVVFIQLIIPGIQHLDLPIYMLSFINRSLLILSSIFLVWLGHRIIEMVSYYFLQKSKLTKNKFDDILIPLLTKTTFVLLYIIGAMYVAYSFTIDIGGIIAGLGIGGLAFAFAAKDTLANFFGSIMLVLDRPFDIGDSIKTGDVEGIVEEVGFRSTKIRTFYDSVITVSNGILANKEIDNFGKRRYRRLNTTLGLEYDTPPEKVEAFCEGIRQIILSHKWTRKDNFNVYFVNFGASSLDIQLMVYWETPVYAREQSEKHRLMIDVLRFANEIGVNFAFPTQTVHMFSENVKEIANEDNQSDDKYFDLGIQKAKKVVDKPLSLKNPRSNAMDKEQFGDNDFGID